VAAKVTSSDRPSYAYRFRRVLTTPFLGDGLQ
jgi:hypothetical protein